MNISQTYFAIATIKHKKRGEGSFTFRRGQMYLVNSQF